MTDTKELLFRFTFVLDKRDERNGEKSLSGHFMLSFCGEDDTDVSDPWYTRDFETAYREILRGCEALLRYTGRQI